MLDEFVTLCINKDYLHMTPFQRIQSMFSNHRTRHFHSLTVVFAVLRYLPSRTKGQNAWRLPPIKVLRVGFPLLALSLLLKLLVKFTVEPAVCFFQYCRYCCY